MKDYGFLSFANNMGKNIGKNISKSWNSKYSKLLDHAKQSATDVFKTGEEARDLSGNKIVNKITRSSKSSPQNSLETSEETLRENYVSLEWRQKIIDDLRLIRD